MTTACGQDEIEIGQVTGGLDELEDGAVNDRFTAGGHRRETSRSRLESVSATT